MKKIKIISYVLIFLVLLFIANKIINQLQYPKENQNNVINKKAIVVGATSGMGRAVAKLLAKNGYQVGLVGRRVELLGSLQKEIGSKTYIKQIDVSKTEEAKIQLQDFIKEMNGLDLMLISVSAQASFDATSISKLDWDNAKKVMDVDLVGFWVSAYVATEHFEKQKTGHLVGISSISAIKGSSFCPEYSGAKAFVSKYLEGIRNRMIKNKIPVFVTDIVPGWVDVERQKYSDIKGSFWVASTQEAASQIYKAIKNKKEKAYITKRWQIVAWFLNIMPDWLYRKIEG